MAELPAFTDASFQEEALKAEGLVVVEFWATWCNHCRKIRRTVQGLAETYADRIKMGRVDVFTEKEVTQQLRIFSTPTVLFFRDGLEVSRLVGSDVRDHLKERLEELAGPAV